MNDRVADSVPIALRGGEIVAITPGDRNVIETLESLEVGRGASCVLALESPFSNQTGNEFTEFVVEQFSRSLGSTLEVNFEDPLAVRLQQPPVLDDGLVGPWITATWLNPSANRFQNDFATYNASGIAPLTSFQNSLSSATASDNVLLETSPVILSSDKVVNSLTVRPSGGGVVVDLGGNRLTVDSGGVLLHHGQSIITNGQLTSGGPGPAELILLNVGEINADIVDGGGGPLSVVVSPTRFSGKIALRGNNSYTGPTIVNNRSELRLASESALPQGTDLIINGGTVSIAYTPVGTQEFGTLVLRDGGRLTESNPSKAKMDFDILQLEDGSIFNIELLGDGILQKTTSWHC